jgi:polyferredoxin
MSVYVPDLRKVKERKGGPREDTMVPAIRTSRGGFDPMSGRRWRNPYRSLPALRAIVQGAYVGFFLLVGYEFHLFYGRIVGGAPVTGNRPAAVEAFLPISALMSLKYFLLTGNYDEIHPAGLTILVAALVSAFLARKVLCSWVCPIGGISRALEWAGERTIWKRRKKEVLLPARADQALTSVKYLLLAFFLYAVVLRMDAMEIVKFQRGMYNYAADAKMLLFFTEMSRVTAVTLAILALLSIVVKNFWCRYLCPYGALLGLVSWISPQRVVRDASTCIDCKACTRACPVEIRVHEKPSVWTPECTGCMSCVAECPVEDCLAVTRRGKAGWSPYLIPLVGLGTIVLFWGVARVTGYWHSHVPYAQLAEAYRQAKSLVHP